MRHAALAVIAVLSACGGESDARLVLRGTIEVPEVDLAALAPARVTEIRVEEGATVRQGDTIAVLTQTDLPDAVAAQAARVRTAEAMVRDLEAGARPEELGQAAAAVEAAEAEAVRAETELGRIRALAAGGAVSRQRLDDAETAARVAAERRAAAREALALLRAGSREERIRAARADLASARATLRAMQARESDLVLLASVDGRVLTRLAEPGEVLSANVPVVTIGALGRPYVRVFARARDLVRIAVGDTVTVVVDGVDGPRATGRVAAISPRAEFTPRVALTEAERADLMFGVRIELVAPAPGLHPGMWAAVSGFRPAPPAAAP